MLKPLGENLTSQDFIKIALGKQHAFVILQNGDIQRPLVVPYPVLLQAIASSINLPAGSAAWGSILPGTGVGSQTDLITYLNNNYYPLSSNPASYVTASQLTTALLSYVTTSALITALLGYVPTSRTLTINGVPFDLSADRSWTIGGGGSPGGSNTQVQYNDGGAFGGDATFTFNETTKVIGVDSLQFSLSPVTGPGAGLISYNGATGALAYKLNSSNVQSEIGETLHALVHNAEAVTITKGQAVYLFQASGNKASVKLAFNTSDATSAKTFGLAAEDISAGTNGFVICQGVLDGLDTSAFTAGDTLYLGATAGSYTATKPYAPNHLVYIGIVERANAGNGQIYVRTQNGYELNELHDVDLITTPPVNNDVLTYNGSLWVSRSIQSVISTIYGSGVDGDVTISINTTLVRDMYYNNLTVNLGVVLNTNGYKVYVKGTLTNNGTIGTAGNNGANGTSSAAPGGGGAATQITAAINTTNGEIFINGGPAGNAGGAGTTTNGASSAAIAAASIYLGGLGGRGGLGGSGSAGSPGNGGLVSSTYNGIDGKRYINAMTESFWLGMYFPFGSISGSGGGAGAGGGAGTGGGSGGGGGSGVRGVNIHALNFVNTGTVRAIGGNGGNGSAPTGLNAGGGAGGGGGGGGFMYLVYGTLTNSGTITVAGGTGGTGAAGSGTGTAGANGANGSAGTLIQINTTTGTITQS